MRQNQNPTQWAQKKRDTQLKLTLQHSITKGGRKRKEGDKGVSMNARDVVPKPRKKGEIVIWGDRHLRKRKRDRGIGIKYRIGRVKRTGWMERKKGRWGKVLRSTKKTVGHLKQGRNIQKGVKGLGGSWCKVS